jgi:hypothetical protein
MNIHIIDTVLRSLTHIMCATDFERLPSETEVSLPSGFNFSSGTLFASLIWGGLGAGFAFYGKKQHSAPPWFGGLALVGISYFINSALWMSVTAVGIIVGIYFWSKNE